LAFYFQKKLENEEKAVVKSGLDEAAAPSVAAAAAPQSARSTGDQEQKYDSVGQCVATGSVRSDPCALLCWRGVG
jgi:uncharacterized protein YgiB involved in biofilm formation